MQTENKKEQYLELWRDDDGFIAQGKGDDYKTFADTNVNDDDIDDREKRTEQLIAAYNNTYAKGINPEAVSPLAKALQDMIEQYGNFESGALLNAKQVLKEAGLTNEFKYTFMNTYEVAKKIKAHLVDLAVNDKLPLDMNALDHYPIEQILREAEDETAFGFDIALQQAKDDGTEITEKEARDVISLMRSKGDVSIGISWDTLSYFISRVVEDRK